MLIVGAPGEDANGDDAGAAYVYILSTRLDLKLKLHVKLSSFDDISLNFPIFHVETCHFS